MVLRRYSADSGGACRGLKLLLVTDLHSRSFLRISEILDIEAPDMICLAGDIAEGCTKLSLDEEGNKNARDFLEKCAKTAPTYYSLGNHEGGMSRENRRIIARMGVTLLDDCMVKFGNLRVAGLTSGYKNGIKKRSVTPPPDLAFIKKLEKTDGFKLILCHHPEYWAEYLSGVENSLTLSGHAHGGQWGLFGRGIYAPGQGFFPKYAGGIFIENDRTLIVSRGAANTVPIPRFFNPCEVVTVEFP